MIKLKAKYEAFRRKKILQFLTNSPPEKLEAGVVKNLLKTFHRAYKSSPAYHELITTSGFNPTQISSLNLFTEGVPLTNKKNYFTKYSLAELAGKNTDDIKLAMTSSGFSGTFAYGFNREKSLKKGRIGVDTTLDYWFDIGNRKSFLINCAPMGVHVETSLPIAEVSVRSDMALALMQKVSPQYDQTILVGDPNFLKKLVEEGCEQSLDWKKLNVSLITAQDWLPESLRSYLAGMLEINLDKPGNRGIYATMGMTELGLNVFHESKQSVTLRRAVKQDSALRNKLLNSPMKAPPCFFHYYPFRTFIETIGNSELKEFVFTLLDKDGIIPVIRYQTGDRGELLPYKRLREALGNRYNSLLPDLKLPLGMLSGRVNNALSYNGSLIFLEDIKEALFDDPGVAGKITGLVGMRLNNPRLQIMVHLKEQVKVTPKLKKLVEEAANKYLEVDAEVLLIEHFDLQEALSLNYEKKLFLP